MKKLIGLTVLCGLLFSGVAQAALYRVDFNGTIVDGTYDGYFIYDDAGLNPAGRTQDFADGLETSLLLNYSYSGASGSFDETTAGLFRLEFDNGDLTNWGIGGDYNSSGTITAGGEADFLIYSNTVLFHLAGSDLIDLGTAASWTVEDVKEISAVPLPGAVWAFGAGLLCLLGMRRRRKTAAREMLPA